MEGKRENCPFDESSLLASFHGSLSSEEAALILTGKPPGTFLFRNSSQGANLFVLSCVRADDQGNGDPFPPLSSVDFHPLLLFPLPYDFPEPKLLQTRFTLPNLPR